jgi:hypothetical protein
MSRGLYIHGYRLIQVGDVLANTPPMAWVYFGASRPSRASLDLPRGQLASIESARPEQHSAQTCQGRFPRVHSHWCDTLTPFCPEC